MSSSRLIPCVHSLVRGVVLLVLLAAHGATAAGSNVLTLHQEDRDPGTYGWDYYYLPYGVEVRGIADDQGLAAWEIEDSISWGEAFQYGYELSPLSGYAEDAWEAGFTLRIHLRLPPQTGAVHPSDGMAGFGLHNGPQLLFGTNAAPPGGDGNLRVLAVGGPPEVVIPGGSVYHLTEIVYDPTAGSYDVLVDSALVISDWAAPTPSQLEVIFGSIGSSVGVGSMRTHRIELEVAIPDCEDDLDNDGDGLVDALDPGCVSGSDDSEADTFACNDGEDDDGDGLVDLADPGCASRRDDIEHHLGPEATAWVADVQLRIEADSLLGGSSFDFSEVGVARLALGDGATRFLQFPAVTGFATAPLGTQFQAAAEVSLPTGTLALSPDVPANTHPLYGALRLCAFYPNCPLNLPFADGPFGLAGIGGTLVLPPTMTFPGTRATLTYAPWTLGTVSLLAGASPTPVPTSRHGFAHGPLSATSTLSQTSGVVQLVTPMQTRLYFPGSGYRSGFVFASLRVHLVPEPRPALLLGAGALLLATLGWLRAR